MDKIILLFFIWVTAVQSQQLITLEKCGLADVVQNGDRIVGGRDAAVGEYPWQVSLKFKNFFIKPTHLCGATILNERWIITAAHCVYRRSVRNFQVVVGINSQEEKKTDFYTVDRIKVHEQFDPETFLNDIAVIQVNKPLLLSTQVNGICLPQVEQNVTGFATTTGWGATLEDGDMSNVLQTVELPLIPSAKCLDIFGPENFSSSEMLCAGELEGGLDSCQASNCQISLLEGIRLLLGFDKRVPVVVNSTLIATETIFGWSLQSKCDELTDSTSVNFFLSERKSVSAEIRRFWELESLGIRGDEITQYRDLFPEICEAFSKLFCVDDLIGGTEQEETVLKIRQRKHGSLKKCWKST
ncbi:serine proteinase stubble [Nephila pilipes]|uniref:Serine proteinase stubble n=1 Tax=Nephila pilipes TaxID=299642 RepID=A0A8X6IF15_NEPPI|nr:serine proteinase stubble [Nephila pilipes]